MRLFKWCQICGQRTIWMMSHTWGHILSGRAASWCPVCGLDEGQHYALHYDNTETCRCNKEHRHCTATAFPPDFLCDYCLAHHYKPSDLLVRAVHETLANAKKCDEDDD